MPSERDPATIGQIETTPEVLAGKPRIAGTRVSVELILAELAGGTDIAELLKAHPHLRREDVSAALNYALRAVRHEEVRPLPEAAG